MRGVKTRRARCRRPMFPFHKELRVQFTVADAGNFLTLVPTFMSGFEALHNEPIGVALALDLDNPGGKVALYMPRLSKRWQFSELHRLDNDVYTIPTLINPCVFR